MRIPSNMIHDIIDDTNKEHITTLLKWLVYEVKSACGDGDAIWYSQYYDINAILPLVEEINKDIKWNVDLVEIPYGKRYISWGENQEGMIITNDERMWNDRPSWQQCSICY